MSETADRLGVHVLTALEKICCRLPEWAAQGFGKCIGAGASLLVARRKVVFADIKKSFPGRFSESQIKKIIRQHYSHLGQMFVETLRMDLWTLDRIKQYVTLHGKENFEDAVKDNQGIVFLAAHFGNWELSQLTADAFFGYPIYVLGQPQKHPRLNEFLLRLRERHGTKAIEVGMGIRGLFKALKEKKGIGMLGDNSPGREEGLIEKFFGRKTAIATGAFELARRTGAVVIPVFMFRTEGERHDVSFEPGIRISENEPTLAPAVQSYVRTLERFIEAHPEQWLWDMKRWKYSWTKRILILSDGKPGHQKQSQAVAEKFGQHPTQYGREGMEYPTETAQIRFQSEWKKRLFPWLSFFVIPWAQGRIGWLRFFLDGDSFQNIEHSTADFIISAGSHLTPLNLFLARGLNAKSIVLMNPGFPYCFYHYDLALVPAHDKGLLPKKSLRLILTPGPSDPGHLRKDADKLRPALKAPEKIKFAIFLGGETRNYQMAISSIEIFYSIMQRIAEKHGDYVLTTSRRTPAPITAYLKQRVMRDPRCQLFVDPKSDPRSEVVGAMMAFADILLVTEDSVSMISEAVLSRKKVIVVTFGGEGLPAKHKRFRKLLEARGAVQILEPRQLEAAMDRMSSMKTADDLIDHENEILIKKIRDIL